MIDWVLELTGSNRPAFLWLNGNWILFLMPVFLLTYYKTRNSIAFTIMTELLISYFLLSLIEPYNQFIFIMAQFITFAIFIVATRNNALVCVSYLLFLLYFIVQFALDSNLALKDAQYELKGDLKTYNIYELAYNLKDLSFFGYNIIIVPAINSLMIKGLFSGWGKGYASSGVHDFIDGYDDSNNSLLSRTHGTATRASKIRNKGIL